MSLLDSALWQGKALSHGWQETSGGEFAVTEKATSKQLGTVSLAAQPAWAATPYIAPYPF